MVTDEGDPWDGNFKDYELSTNAERIRSADETVAGNVGFGVVALTCGVFRAEQQQIQHDPRPQEDPTNDAHTLVVGDKPRSRRKRFVSAAVWRIRPAAR